MPHPSLQHPLLNHEFSVLDHGSVMLVDFMGTEADILTSARNSYKGGTKQVSDDETCFATSCDTGTPLRSSVVRSHCT